MWTNIFRIGELQAVSWFQFLPIEPDPNAFSEKSLRAEQKDSATYLILSAHIQLQNEGFLSTWTNSFVGPWDPSQGVHNPDEKIKLWLFLPGHHSSIVEGAQAAVSRLRVVGTGLWLAPGDCEEVAVALSQALRNSIERTLRGFSYVRFGDVFTRCHSSTQNEKSFRRPQPTFEFVFAATEEAIYVHVVVSAKYIRGLCSEDIENNLLHSHSAAEGIPVIVAPNGMLGRLTGCCPSDVVRQVYISKLTPSYGSTTSVPYVAQSSGHQLRGQSYYVEVALGCPSAYDDKALELDGCPTKIMHHIEDSKLATAGRQRKLGTVDNLPVLERTFIYPPEAIVIPMMHRAFGRFSSKRLWLQNWMGTSFWEMWPFWNFSGFSFIEHCLAFEGSSYRGLTVNSSYLRLHKHFNSSSNSISSSISSVSSTSSDSECVVAAGGGDLEADADSLMCKQSGLLSNNQIGNSHPKTDAFDSAYNVVDANNSAAAAVTSVKGGSLWSWDDDGIGMDIQTLLSEFGDFGDFFENDGINFGEPPGTAESQALVLPVADCGDIVGSSSPNTIDMPDQRLSPVGLTSFEGVNHPSVALSEDVRTSNIELVKETSPGAGNQTLASSAGKFDHLTQAEAMMTFATEYAAVEIPASEVLTSLFASPYLPGSRKAGNSQSSCNGHAYIPMPLSPGIETLEEKHDVSLKSKSGSVGHDANSSKLYTLILNGGSESNKSSVNTDMHPLKAEAMSCLSGITSLGSSLTLQKTNDKTFDVGQFLLSKRTVLATEIECIMFQAIMCRIRHTLLSLKRRVPTGMKSCASDLIQTETDSKLDVMRPQYDTRKKDIKPVRIVGNIDGEVHDGSHTTQVGVWRPVGAPKGASKGMKPLNVWNSESVNVLTGEGLDGFVQRLPLLDLLCAMALLVQQSTSFVDLALDSDDGDSPYFWLALQEQRRRGFSCDPSMVHAGCGGLLATCHSVDFAGADLTDPLAADVPVSSMISLLQSDIKVALKSAFGSLDGPLSVIDWCKGRSHVGDSGATVDGYSFLYAAAETRDSSSTVTLGGEPLSPPQSSSVSSCIGDGARTDEPQRKSHLENGNSDSEQKKGYRVRPTVALLPSSPSILVGYQDDWLKTSANCLKLWEKAPLEPYALPKPVTFYAMCPDVDLLMSAATDFFQQLGTVYEACKLGTHLPQTSGQAEISTGKCLPPGFIPVECPQQVKVGGSHFTSVSSINDYFLALSKGWNVKSFVNVLAKTIKDLRFPSSTSVNQKESSGGTCTVLYVVCPFPEPSAVLRTLVGCSAALGSLILSPEKEKISLMHSQVAKALNCTSAADEASASKVLMLSGFSISNLVLQIVTLESILRINRPINDLAVLKDIAFTVYNKARRIPRAVFPNEMYQSTSFPGRSQSAVMHVGSPIPGLWKDCLVPRMSGPSLAKEAEFDTPLRPVTWDSSWQSSRVSGLPDQNKAADLCSQDDKRFMFEPLFVLAEPGSVEHSAFSESSNSKSSIDDSSGVYGHNSTSLGSSDSVATSLLDGSDNDPKAASLHCSYGWTEDWRWLICVWTDSRGELLDSYIFPFGGISSLQDTKVLQSLFVQVLHQGCQIISSTDAGTVRPRNIIITRVGGFFELECQEWQKAIYSFGGNEVKKWPVQLRRLMPEGLPSNANGSSLQQQELGLLQERNQPPSPSPSLYSPHSKPSFMKGALGQSSVKKQLLPGQTGVDGSRGSLQLVQSISLVGVSLDHSLHLVLQADATSSGGLQSGSGHSAYLEGFSPVKSVGSMLASYLLIPSPSLRYLSPNTLQLPTCLTSESPPLAHLLHSKGLAIPLATGYVVSKAVPQMRRDFAEPVREDWPSVLAVTLVNHYGGSNAILEEKITRAASNCSLNKQGRSFAPDLTNRDFEMEIHSVLESLAAELHSLSWMTASPVYVERRTALPFHCDMVLRLRRLLHYADKELSQSSEKMEPA